MIEFPCKWGCGTILHYDNNKVLQGDNTPHNCPNAPWKQKKIQSVEESSPTSDNVVKALNRIADALENIARK